VIKTERLTLRNWAYSDENDFVRLADDPSVLRWTGRTVPVREMFLNYVASDTAFAVLLGGEVIGCVSLFKNRLTQSATGLDLYETAFYLFPEEQGKGYGSEAVKAVLDHAFRKLGADGVIAGTMLDNRPAHKLIESLGGVYCFTREEEDFYLFRSHI